MSAAARATTPRELPTRVLVTGASGFIGAHVATRLAAAGHEVVALAGHRPIPPELADRCAAVMHGDLVDPAYLGDALSQVEAVCHLAGRVPPDHSDPAEAERCWRVNALATLELARLAAARGVTTFIHASSGNAYAPGPGPLPEDWPVWPSRTATWYLVSKMAAELYLDHLRQATALRVVVLRLSSCYGPGMAAGSVLARFVEQARRRESICVRYGGLPTADFVHASDVADCFAAALDRGGDGVYNVGSGRATTLLELAEAVNRVFGSGAEVLVQPPQGPPWPGFGALSIERAAAAWGYRPMGLSAGLRALADRS